MQEKSEDKVEFRYEPFREVIVMEIIKFQTPDDLARFANIIAGGKTPGLYWANGIAILHFSLPPTTETTSKELVEKGRIYWTLLSYAMMPQYRSIIETKEKIIVPVVDMTTDPLFLKAAEWIKRREQTG